jgi:hypothetical protein
MLGLAGLPLPTSGCLRQRLDRGGGPVRNPGDGTARGVVYRDDAVNLASGELIEMCRRSPDVADLPDKLTVTAGATISVR